MLRETGRLQITVVLFVLLQVKSTIKIKLKIDNTKIMRVFTSKRLDRTQDGQFCWLQCLSNILDTGPWT